MLYQNKWTLPATNTNYHCEIKWYITGIYIIIHYVTQCYSLSHDCHQWRIHKYSNVLGCIVMHPTCGTWTFKIRMYDIIPRYKFDATNVNHDQMKSDKIITFYIFFYFTFCCHLSPHILQEFVNVLNATQYTHWIK